MTCINYVPNTGNASSSGGLHFVPATSNFFRPPLVTQVQVLDEGRVLRALDVGEVDDHDLTGGGIWGLTRDWLLPFHLLPKKKSHLSHMRRKKEKTRKTEIKTPPLQAGKIWIGGSGYSPQTHISHTELKYLL